MKKKKRSADADKWFEAFMWLLILVGIGLAIHAIESIGHWAAL